LNGYPAEAHDYKVVLQELCSKVNLEDAKVILAVFAKVCSKMSFTIMTAYLLATWPSTAVILRMQGGALVLALLKRIP
jgi:hypothetical protein